MRDDPELTRQGQADLLICQGRVQQAAIASMADDAGSYIAAGQALDDIRRGCMAERGYLPAG